mgnify:CR=1 FL=1
MVPDTVKDDIQAIRDELTGGTLDVNIASGGAGDGAILDGASSSIKATVKDLTNANPLTVAIVDTSGDQIASFGGGTQYTEGDTDATIVGTAIMWEDAGNALTPVSSSKPLPVSASIDPTGLATSAKQDTIIGHVDGIETLLGTIDADTSNISTKIDTIVGHVDGLETLIGTTNTTLTTIDGRVDGIEGLLTTIDGDTGNIVTSVQLLDDTVATDGSATPTKGILMAGQDGTNAQTIKTDSSGELQVDVLTMPTTTVTATDLDIRPLVNTDVVTAELSSVDNAVLDTIAAKDFATQATLAAMNAKMVSGTDIGDVTINNASGASAVNIQDGGNTITVDGTVGVSGTVAVTQSGTWDEVGINDSGNSITVDYATTGSGTATGALRVELPTNGTGVIATVGAVTAITNALPAGTNAIGKLSANSGVDIGDVDVTSVSGTVTTKGIPSDIDINGSNANHADKYYTNAGAVTDGIVWSPAAGKRWHVLTLYINVSAAATVTLEDDLAGGDVVRWKGELAANSGVILTYDKEHPFCSGEDAADLIITTTAGNVYVQAVGYEI